MAKVLAKTNGITLRAHTDHVVAEARALLDALPFVEATYARFAEADLRRQLVRAAKVHDQGKRHKDWQSACQADYAAFLRTGRSAGMHLRKACLRHEFASLVWAERKGIDLTLAERIAIAAHHGKLSHRHEHRWRKDGGGAFHGIWEDLCREQSRWLLLPPEDLTEQALRERYRLAGVRSLLQLADVRASRQEGGSWVPEPSSFRFAYRFPYEGDDGAPSYRGVQEVAQAHADARELILRAPTGSGKTDAALLWAQRQVEAGRADRCVIAMPTRFTSNALALGVEANVSDTGLYHSSAWYARYQGDLDQEEDDRARREAKDRAQEMHRMARLLMTPVTVCTIDHLLIALTGTREDHHSIFFNLMHACVVIDEADFYDPFVQANMLVLLRVLRHFEVPVLIMSATVPDAAQALYGIDTLAEDRSDLDRVRCHVHDGGAAETAGDLAGVMSRVLDADVPQAIVYANTVRRALMYYDWFCEQKAKPILYHSRFTEPDKKARESELIDALGREAWEKGTARGIAILTQIGEMSLNISAPLMISELCPYDRLAQRAGRLSRFAGMAPGDLYVVEPRKAGELYPAPYGSYDQDERAWTPAPALLKTQRALRYGPHTAQDFIAAVDDLYPDVETFAPTTSRIERNQQHLVEHLERYWMIVPAHTPGEDEHETLDWKSRDIPAQRTVMTQRPEAFDGYAAFRRFELECGVACAPWQIEVGTQKGRVAETTCWVGDEEESTLYSPVYSPTEGLILDQDRERSLNDRCL